MSTAATRRSPEATLGAAVAHPLQMSLPGDPRRPGGQSGGNRPQLGLEVSNVGYHVTALAEAGLIEEVGQRPVRGAVEHFYRAVVRPITSDEEEAGLTAEQR